jgi:hypothetical protein
MTWVEPAVLGSMLWAIIERVPATTPGRPPFDFRRFDAAESMIATSEQQTSGLVPRHVAIAWQ